MGFIDTWRSREFPALLGGKRGGGEGGGAIVYADHAGAALPMRSQLSKSLEESIKTVLCNPHSNGPGSGRTKELIDESRHMVLNHFFSKPQSFNLVFTSNCSDSLNILSSSFAFERGSLLVFAKNSHTSVVGCRENARRRGGTFKCLTLEEMGEAENWPIPDKPSLVVIPAECNFGGRLADVRGIVEVIRGVSDKYYVALDVAKYAAFHEVDLGELGVDFAVGSFYKMFGSPTGLGFLFMRRAVVERVLKVEYFGGGGVNAVLPGEDFVVKRRNVEEVLEPGTVDFRGIVGLRWGFRSLQELGGVEKMRKHVKCLSGEFRRRMGEVGGDSVVFHSDVDSCSIVSFSLRNKDGGWVGYNEVINLAELNDPPIQMRGGCFCNQGACLEALGESGGGVKSEECALWFERVLKVKCFLAREAKLGEGFANEAPLLLISGGSVRRLNQIGKTMGRQIVDEISFRPNFIVDDGGNGGNIEDEWQSIEVGGVCFKVQGPCSRCNMVEVDPNRARQGKGGVLRTLGNYRRSGGRIIFGVFVQRTGGGQGGSVKVGEKVRITGKYAS
ncbi:hypothetical protein TrRE_jg4146 [Triparma retinervis]|uniref:MOSC domain-containing protein n=1 Tax=Triparma retinervis TaxID=2557542 RepID=A0A9W6Z1E3_9STRA|nr:hypothetical protein TrRE_jg4146 [Triparma retinervis]